MILCNNGIFPIESWFSPNVRKIEDLKFVFLIDKVIIFYVKGQSRLIS